MLYLFFSIPIFFLLTAPHLYACWTHNVSSPSHAVYIGIYSPFPYIKLLTHCFSMNPIVSGFWDFFFFKTMHFYYKHIFVPTNTFWQLRYKCPTHCYKYAPKQSLLLWRENDFFWRSTFLFESTDSWTNINIHPYFLYKWWIFYSTNLTDLDLFPVTCGMSVELNLGQ